MASRRRSLALALLATAALPASASAALTKVADPISVAPDAPARLSQYYPDVGMAADGSFAVSYSEPDDKVGSDSERVKVQRFTAAPAKVGSPIAFGPAGARSTFPAIAMAPDGRFAVIYETFAAPNRHIEVQRFSAAGAPIGAAILPDGTAQDNSGEPPAIAMAADGRFAVAWIAFNGGSPELHERAYGADGTPLSAVNVLGTGINHGPAIGMAPDGRFVVSAVQPSTYDPVSMTFSNEDVPAWRFHADGSADGARGSLYTGAAGNNYNSPALGMSDGGALFAAWGDQHGGGDFQPDIWARRFDAAGTPLGDRFIANDDTTYAQVTPDVETTGDGTTLLAYGGQDGTTQRSYLRVFGPDGTPGGTGEPLAGAASGTQMLAHVDSDGAGRAAFAWTGGSNAGANSADVFVGRWNYAAVTEPPPSGDGGGGTTTPPATTTPAATTPAPVGGASPAPLRPAPPARPSRPLSAAAVLAQSISFPPTRTCASRRNFGIRLRVPKGSIVRQATVKVNDKTVAVRRGTRLRSTVDLRRLPKGRFTVTITLRLADGRTVRGERRYRTCAARARGGRPKV